MHAAERRTIGVSEVIEREQDDGCFGVGELHRWQPEPFGDPEAAEPWLAFACGRYEGIDERVLVDAATSGPVLTLSLGDYVLNGGEVAVLAVVEAVVRLLPGVVGNAESLVEESHEGGLLEYPVYTKPASWRGLDVPDVLLSGHHGNVARWRQDQRLRRTAERRPDLLTPEQRGELLSPGEDTDFSG